MSLIFTSNTQDTYNQENGQSTNFGIEQPADYHNRGHIHLFNLLQSYKQKCGQ